MEVYNRDLRTLQQCNPYNLNMKISLILTAVVASCVAQPPPGWHPSGRALLLPSRIQESPTTPTPQPSNAQSDQQESERVLDSGEYYVLLEDGRLQMVKYSTAALKEQADRSDTQAKSQQSQQYQQYPVYQRPQQYQYPQQYQQPQQYHSESSGASSNLQQQVNAEPFSQFQLEYVQFPLPGSQFTQTKLEYTVPETKPDVEEQKSDDKETTGYEANIQYRDVKPISAPIYAYNPTPLVRILKK